VAQFDNFIDLAKKLINKNGRPINLLQETKTTPDATKPWRAVNVKSTLPLNGVKAVFIDYSINEIGGGLIKRGDKKCLIASDDVAIQKADIRNYDLVIDGAEEWVIKNMTVLRPGDQVLMYTLQLRLL